MQTKFGAGKEGYCYKYYEFEISLDKIIRFFLGTCFCV
jgi:hypothetical protein